MRGSDAASGALFSYVDMEARVPATHPLRTIRTIVNEVLDSLDTEFEVLYEGTGRQSVAPERLLRASLLQAFYSVRSERQLMEQINYNLLFRWFVGLGIDDAVWDQPGVPTHAAAWAAARSRCGFMNLAALDDFAQPLAPSIMNSRQTLGSSPRSIRLSMSACTTEAFSVLLPSGRADVCGVLRQCRRRN